METGRFGIGKSAESCSVSFAHSKSIALSIAGDESNAQRKTDSGSQGHAESNSGSQGHAESNSGGEAPNRDETASGKNDEHAAAVATAN